jgi:VanZ family protein
MGHRSRSEKRGGTTRKQLSTDTLQLALMSRQVLDIPTRTRNVILVAALAAVVLVVVGCLVGDQETTIETDKILHFTAYFSLAFLFVVALGPRLYVPALVGLAALGFLIECLQPLNGRSYDLKDALANLIGVAIGAGVALIVRWGYARLRADLAIQETRRRVRWYFPGEIILSEGWDVSQFYIIKSGVVRLSRKAEGKEIDLGNLEAGEVIGVLPVIDGRRQQVTAEAMTETSVYAMDLGDLIDSAGGQALPVAKVLQALAQHLRWTLDRLAEANLSLDNSGVSDSLSRE